MDESSNPFPVSSPNPGETPPLAKPTLGSFIQNLIRNKIFWAVFAGGGILGTFLTAALVTVAVLKVVDRVSGPNQAAYTDPAPTVVAEPTEVPLTEEAVTTSEKTDLVLPAPPGYVSMRELLRCLGQGYICLSFPGVRADGIDLYLDDGEVVPAPFDLDVAWNSPSWREKVGPYTLVVVGVPLPDDRVLIIEFATGDGAWMEPVGRAGEGGFTHLRAGEPVFEFKRGTRRADVESVIIDDVYLLPYRNLEEARKHIPWETVDYINDIRAVP